MVTRKLATVTWAALLLGASFLPVQALELNLGGISVSAGPTGNSGTVATVGVGDTSVAATVGGGTNLATAAATTNNSGLSVGVGGANGPLITTANNNGVTSANVNLGLGGLGLGGVNDVVNGVTGPVGEILGDVTLPGGGGGNGGGGNGGGGNGGGGTGNGTGIDATQIASAFGALSGSEQEMLKVRCRSILMKPAAFDSDLIALCRLLNRMVPQ